MSTSPIGIGLLGCGMMSQVGHLPFYAADPRCKIVRIAESRPSIAAALGDQFGRERIVSDHRDLLQDDEVKAVVLSAPRPATGPLTLETLEAGKHILAEKPMAHSAEQAARLVDAAAARDLIYAVGYMKRYDPGIIAAKAVVQDMIEGGRLGRLLFARFYDYSNAYAMAPPPHVRPKESRTIRFSTWPTYPDWLDERHRGVFAWFMNAGSHDLNLLRFFFPEASDVVSARVSADSCVTAVLKSEDLTLALEVTKTTAGRWLEGAEFLFERGRVTLTIPSPMAVGRASDVFIDDLDKGLTNHPVPVHQAWCFEEQAIGFVDTLCDGAKPLTTGADGLEDLRLIEKIWTRISEQ